MRFLKCSWVDLMEMPDGYDDVAVEVSRRESAQAEARRRTNR